MLQKQDKSPTVTTWFSQSKSSPGRFFPPKTTGKGNQRYSKYTVGLNNPYIRMIDFSTIPNDLLPFSAQYFTHFICFTHTIFINKNFSFLCQSGICRYVWNFFTTCTKEHLMAFLTFISWKRLAFDWTSKYIFFSRHKQQNSFSSQQILPDRHLNYNFCIKCFLHLVIKPSLRDRSSFNN